MNGEVRGEISRRWKRFRQNHHLDSPWSQYSITNNSRYLRDTLLPNHAHLLWKITRIVHLNGCRTNTTRWRTSFHSIQITSIGDRRDLRLRSLTPPLIACYSSNPNNSNSYDSGTRSTSVPGSLHQSISSHSTAASTRTCCSKSSTIANRLEKVFIGLPKSQFRVLAHFWKQCLIF